MTQLPICSPHQDDDDGDQNVENLCMIVMTNVMVMIVMFEEDQLNNMGC